MSDRIATWTLLTLPYDEADTVTPFGPPQLALRSREDKLVADQFGEANLPLTDHAWIGGDINLYGDSIILKLEAASVSTNRTEHGGTLLIGGRIGKAGGRYDHHPATIYGEHYISKGVGTGSFTSIREPRLNGDQLPRP